MPRSLVLVLALALLVPQVAAQRATQSLDNTTVQLGNSVACATNGNPPPQLSAENSYLRNYDLIALGITNQITITSVSFGIELAQHQGTVGMQPIEIRIYTEPMATALFPDTTGLTLVNTTAFMLPDQMTTTIWRQQLSAPVNVLPIDNVIVEIYSPDGTAGGNHLFFLGTNNLGESAPTYLQAGTCGLPTPGTYASIGFANVHGIIDFHYTTGTPTIDITQPGGPGTDAFLLHDQLLPGNTYFTFYSFDTSGPIGFGPFAGLYGSSINDFLLPFSLPANVSPLHIVPTADNTEFLLGIVPAGLAIDVLVYDLTNPAFPFGSDVTRYTFL